MTAPPRALSFGDFYDRERPGAVRLAALLCGSPSQAEDLVQEAFLAVHARFASLDRPGAYLRTTVVNLVRADHRRLTRRLARRHLVFGAELVDAVEPPDAALLAAVGRLPLAQRTVVVLRSWADLPDDEIAEVLGCRPATVRSHAHRAYARLRDELTP